MNPGTVRNLMSSMSNTSTSPPRHPQQQQKQQQQQQQQKPQQQRKLNKSNRPLALMINTPTNSNQYQQQQQQRQSPVMHMNASASKRSMMSPSQRNEVKEAFELFDSDNSGYIDATELQVALKALGFAPSADSIKQMMNDLDKDHNGQIDLDEFMAITSSKIEGRDTRDDLENSFRLFDDDETGQITVENLQRLAEELGEHMSLEELQGMIKEADRSGQGQVSIEDFIRVMEEPV